MDVETPDPDPVPPEPLAADAPPQDPVDPPEPEDADAVEVGGQKHVPLKALNDERLKRARHVDESPV